MCASEWLWNHEKGNGPDLFTPKALHRLAQGNTLGIMGTPDHTLKALNNDPDAMHNQQLNEL